MYFHTGRHWNKTYQKNILSFREHDSVRNNISIVAVNYYYFVVWNLVFGERSTPKRFQLRKAGKRVEDTVSVSNSWYSLNWTYFRLHFLQSTTIPLLYVLHHGSLSNTIYYSWESSKRASCTCTITSWRHCCGTTKYKYIRVWTKHLKFCLKGAWGSLFMYYIFQIKLLFSDKKHLHSDVQIHDFVF